MCSLTRFSTKVVSVRMALRNAFVPLAPCPMKQTPLTPSSGAAPYSSQSSRALSRPSAGIMNSEPNSASGSRLISSFTARPRKFAALSAVLRITLPVKPSVTITSHVPLNRSRPSTLPMKFRCFAPRSSGSVSCTSWLPLVSSSPMDIRPTRGLSRPSRWRA